MTDFTSYSNAFRINSFFLTKLLDHLIKYAMDMGFLKLHGQVMQYQNI